MHRQTVHSLGRSCVATRLILCTAVALGQTPPVAEGQPAAALNQSPAAESQPASAAESQPASAAESQPAGAASARGPAAAAPEELAWIKEHALVFKTPEAGNGLDDLRGLKEIVGDARVVALGEGTHGTREFFQMKHRLVEYLATELGFTIFSIEANMPEAYRLNDYVLHGRGDPKDLIAGMYFWTWNTEEVLAMVEWMRQFNESGKGRIEFTGFDMQTPDVAMDIVLDFLRRVEPDYAARATETYTSAKTAAPGVEDFGVATGWLPAALAAGKRIKYSGWIRTENVTLEWAGLWCRADGEGQGNVLAFDNMGNRGASGTTPWTRYEIELDIPKDTVNIAFGVLHTGNGTAWFDSLQVEIDGQPVSPRNDTDLGFDSEPARGFRTGGQSYMVNVVTDQPQAGKGCLRMRYLGHATSQAIPAAQAIRQCRDVYEHLKSQRATYIQKEPERDVDWAIQNARVALQAVQCDAGQTIRDSCMAENVQWIRQQNPDAKLVLWAHNGHVCKTNPTEPSTMGGFLKKPLGDKLLVVGFTCGAGQYQAIKQGAGLQANDLQAPLPGSAEDRFRQTGLPRFILDVRGAPAAGAPAAWLTRPVMVRSIGALAMDVQFESDTLCNAFDVLIYFDQTTAARKIKR